MTRGLEANARAELQQRPATCRAGELWRSEVAVEDIRRHR